MKKALSLIIILMLLLSALPMTAYAASPDEAPEGAQTDTAVTGGYTDPSSPFIAYSYEELRKFVNEYRFIDDDPWTMSDQTYYVKLGKNVSYSGYKEGTLRTNGANVVIDLAGYTISYTDTSNYGNSVVAGTYGSVTVNDSRRYDYSAGKYVDGKIDYKYELPYDDANTATLCGKIIVNGGTIVNRTTSKAVHSAYANMFYDKNHRTSASGYIKLNGGVLEAQQPLYLGCSKGTVLNGGELRVKKDVGVMMYIKYSPSSISAAELPTVTKCTMTNASGNEQAVAFVQQFTSDDITKTQALGFFSGMLSSGSYAFIDDVVQGSFLAGTSYGAGSVMGPLFYTSYAAYPSTRIDELKATISEPMPGDKPSYNAYVPNGVKYQVENFTAGIFKYGVSWARIDGSTRTTITPGSSTVFEAGKTYEVEILLEPETKYLYHFASADAIAASVNGKSAAVKDYEDGSYGVLVRFTCPQKTTISKLELTIPEPKNGGQITYSASAPSGKGYTVKSDYKPTSSYWKNGVQWACAGPDDIYYKVYSVDAAGSFEVGNLYLMTAAVAVTDTHKYIFAPDSLMTATVNGKEAVVVDNKDGTYSVMFDVNITHEIDTVALTVTEPSAGVKISYSPSVPAGADYMVEDYTNETNGWYKGVRWLENNNPLKYTGAKTFEAGNRYEVIISIVPKSEEYAFVSAAGLTATINGKAAKVTDYGDGSVGLSCTFTVLDVIDTIDVTVPEPKAGALMSYDAAVPADAGYVIQDYTYGAWLHGVEWEDEFSAFTPNSGNTFTAGKDYTVSVLIVITDPELFEFAPGMSMIAYVNGKWADLTWMNDTTYRVKYTFSVPAVTTIDALTVTVTEPKAGSEPDYAASVPSGKGYMVEDFDGAHWHDGVLWEDKNGYMDGSFKAGEEYTVTVSIVLTDSVKYRFADAESMTATVNGKPAEITAFSDGSYGVMYTFKVPAGAYWIGDVNNDGAVKNRDALILDRYIAGWKNYDQQIKNWDAADLNRDGQVKNRDALMLDRYIAGWASYQKYVYQVNG